jgi:hypothetical protein
VHNGVSMNTEVDLVPKASREMITGAVEGACQLAERIKVTSVELNLEAANALKSVKGAQKIVESTKDGLTDPLELTIKRITAFFKGPKDRLQRAENLLKGQMLAFEEEQKEKARKEQARLDEIARQERLKKEAQAQAAAEKARIEAAAGNTVKAEKLQAKADMLAEVSASIVAPIVRIETPRVAGVTSRETWSATVTAMRMLVLSVAGSLCAEMSDEEIIHHMRKFCRTPIQALQADSKFLNAQARALKVKGEFYPGVFGVVSRGIAAGSD